MSLFRWGSKNRDDVSDNATFSELYTQRLKEALETDLTDVLRSGCVSKGRDQDGLPVLVFIPRIGFGYEERTAEFMHLMFLLFIKTADLVVTQPYKIVYSHVNINWLNQQPVIFDYYKMLPRKYKKNIVKIYVLLPTAGIKVFLEFARLFLSHKFYNKLEFVNTVAEFQRSIPPHLAPLPLRFLAFEDEDRHLQPSGVSIPLEVGFDAEGGAPVLLSRCAFFLREKGRLRRQGLFRVAGDEVSLRLAKVRLQPPASTSRVEMLEFMKKVIIGHGEGEETKSREDSAVGHRMMREDSADGGTNDTSFVSTLSSIVVDDVDTVAQIFKLCIRDLAEPLLTFAAFEPLLELTVSSKVVQGSSTVPLDDWNAKVIPILQTLPAIHQSVLSFLLDFLREVAAESDHNNMDIHNLSTIFAPTVLRPPLHLASSSVPVAGVAKAFDEIRSCQVILKRLLEQPLSRRVYGLTTLVAPRVKDTFVASVPTEESIGDSLNDKMKARFRVGSGTWSEFLGL